MKKGCQTAVSLVLIIILMGIVASAAFSPLSDTSKPSPSTSISTQNTSYNNSSAELLRFVERLLTHPGFPSGKPVAILPGELPSNLSVEVPIPNDTEVIGSLVRSDDTYKQVEIILDVPMEPNEVIEFYRNRLEEAGWNETEGFSFSEGGGFVSTMPESAIFCRYEREGPSLMITAYTLATKEGNVSDTRLHLDTDPRTSVCRERFFGPPCDDRAEVIPLLKPPEGAILRCVSSGGGEYRWNSEATIKTELNVSELENHYRKQLLEAGWELKEEGNTSSFVWSTWSSTDEFGDHWSGILLVSEGGEENLRFLYLMVHLVY